MSPLDIALALGLPLFVGAAGLLALGATPRRDALAFLGMVFPLGALAIGLLLFGWMHIGGPLVGGSLQAVVCGLGLLLALVAGIRLKVETKKELRNADTQPAGRAGRLVFLILLALALGDVGFRVLADFGEPIARGDSALIWTIRAKILFQHGAIDAELTEMLTVEYGAHHLDYPLLNPLLQVWIMSTAGEIVEWAVRLPTHMWHASLVLVCFAAARRRAGPIMGAALAWLLFSLPQFPTIAAGTIMDLPVLLAFLGLCDRLLRVAEERDSPEPNLALACVWAGILVWSKNEGWMLLVGTSLAAALGLGLENLRRFRSPGLALAVLPLGIIAAQVGFNRRFGFENDLMSGGSGERAPRLDQLLVENMGEKAEPLLRYYVDLALDFERSRWLLLLFLAALVFGRRAAWGAPTRFCALAIGAGWCGYFLVYIASIHDLTWHLATSGLRTTVHLMGAIVLFLACCVRDVLAELRGGEQAPRSPLARAPSNAPQREQDD